MGGDSRLHRPSTEINSHGARTIWRLAMMAQDTSSLLVAGEQAVHRPARALIGWLTPSEATTMLLGRNPKPGEDVEAHLKATEPYRESVARRDPRIFTDPIVDDDRFSS